MKFQNQMEIFSYLLIRRNYIKLFLLICGISACQHEKAFYPILDDEDKLVNVFVDLYIAESTLNKQPVWVRDSLRTSFRNNIILIHDLSEDEFDTLFFLVQTDMESYKELNAKAVARIEELSKELESREEELEEVGKIDEDNLLEKN